MLQPGPPQPRRFPLYNPGAERPYFSPYRSLSIPLSLSRPRHTVMHALRAGALRAIKYTLRAHRNACPSGGRASRDKVYHISWGFSIFFPGHPGCPFSVFPASASPPNPRFAFISTGPYRAAGAVFPSPPRFPKTRRPPLAQAARSHTFPTPTVSRTNSDSEKSPASCASSPAL